MSANEELVELGDLDELLRHADRLARGGWWDDLVDLRERCRAALERGRQLWPISARAEYLLALEAPGEHAASVLVPGAGRFTPGPLAEVAAVNHTWRDLAPHLDVGSPEAAVFAHERVLYDEDLSDVDGLDRSVLDIPLRLQAWEPSYPLAGYTADRTEFPLEEHRGLAHVDLPGPAPTIDDGEATDAIDALRDLARAWTDESNGRSEAVAVDGGAAGALAALGLSRCRTVEISPSRAFAVMAWTAASGGANGRRRGMAAGRFAAWWAGAALTGILDDWPVTGDELGEAVRELRWFTWDAGAPETGWSCRLAVEDPANGLAWAFNAADVAL